MTDGDLAMVFVIDDDPQVRASIRGLLKSSGLRWECFETAERKCYAVLQARRRRRHITAQADPFITWGPTCSFLRLDQNHPRERSFLKHCEPSSHLSQVRHYSASRLFSSSPN